MAQVGLRFGVRRHDAALVPFVLSSAERSLFLQEAIIIWTSSLFNQSGVVPPHSKIRAV